ncbi:Uncharacterised protein [Mycobacteroides abscessus subsp. massiliense]|nr:Uncharacterised protein [Mycobacteroides abscessus subsp. massiliense]
MYEYSHTHQIASWVFQINHCLYVVLLLIASPLLTLNRVSAFVSRQTSSGDSHGYNTEHTGNHEVYQHAHTYRTRTNELPRDTYTRPSMYA